MTIKVLVIDDSAFMRKFLRELFGSQPDMQVAVAGNGAEGLEMIREDPPDVVTLDINMPVMDGLTCLSHIMTECPTQVIMVSSLTKAGELATLEALAMGAVDYIEKPGGTVSLNMDLIEEELLGKVRNAAKARARHRRSGPRKATARPSTEARRATSRSSAAEGRAARGPVPAAPSRQPRVRRSSSRFDLCVLGCSTGGPGALEEVLAALPADFPIPMIVAQHMPQRFTKSFADRLDGRCEVHVTEVSRSQKVMPGTVYIGRGDADVILAKRGADIVVNSVPHDESCPWAPSVDRMVKTAMDAVPAKRILAIMLTGMGDDGAERMTELRGRGGHTIAESEETAVIWGMPGKLVEHGGADEILPLQHIGRAIDLATRNERKPV